MKLKWEHQIEKEVGFNSSFYPKFLSHGENIYIIHNAGEAFRPEFREIGVKPNHYIEYIMCNEFNPIRGFVNSYLFTIPKDNNMVFGGSWKCCISDNRIFIDTQPYEYEGPESASSYYHKVLCLDLTNGDFYEHSECDPVILPRHDYPEEVFANNKYRIYRKSTQSIICEDANTKEVLWRQKTKLSSVGAIYTEHNGKLFFTTARTNGFMYCIDIKNGEILLMHDMYLSSGHYALHNGTVYFGNKEGQITAVSEETFTVIDTVTTTYLTEGLPINIINNHLYTITRNPNGGATAVVCCEL